MRTSEFSEVQTETVMDNLCLLLWRAKQLLNDCSGSRNAA